MTEDNPIIRVLVVDDHPMLREGIKSLARVHLSNRTQAVLYALRKGLVDLEPDDLE